MALRALERAYSPGHHGRWSARRRADLVDEAVRALAEGLDRGMAVVALGGYGRRLLLPGSDVDLMVLHADRRARRVGASAEGLFYPFWDAGIALGHSVRSVDECLSLAVERLDVACSLLDARPLWGELTLFRDLEDRLRRRLGRDPGGFLDRLGQDVEDRKARFPSCSTDLEPDLKEGSGGLRDLHAVGWAGRVSPDAVVRRAEAEALDEAEEFLVRLRSALHIETGKRTDRLFLDHQPSLASHFGFEAAEGLGAPDALMRSLFRHARLVEHVRDRVLEPRAGAVDVAPPSTPDEVLEAFAASAATGIPLSPAALDAIEAADLGPVPYPWTDRTRRAFLEILSAGEAGRRALEAIDRGDLLGRFLPEWEPVRCRPQRDPYHRFTVDVHLLHAAATAADLLAGRRPGATGPADAVGESAPVLLGTFLHDIGKIGRGRHIEVGTRVAAEALERMGVEGATRDDALFLVEHHLLLADTAVRRDLSDENLVLDVAARVGDPRRLAMLLILTLADAEATGPHAASPWRLALVNELAGKVRHVLEAGDMGPDRAALLDRRRAAVRGLLAAEPADAVERYLDRLPRAYLASVPPATAAAHLRLVGPPLAAAEVRTLAGPGERPGTHQVTVVAADRPGLLARIAGCLSLEGLAILSARAFTTEDGTAVDLFEVTPAFHGEVDEERWRRFRRTLRRALEGRVTLEHRVREKRRHYPPPSTEIDSRVRILNDESAFSTVIEVETADRIGLLFDLARALEELDLDVHLARVATYGDRVVDAFYVRDVLGGKVDPGRAGEIERGLLATLQEAG
ncbi:MAG: HD domain-containing protein [Actinomycetota bacterium]